MNDVPEAARNQLSADPPPYRLIILPFMRRIGARLFMPNWLAITIWRWIFAWRPLDGPELAHELEHVRQWRANSLRFIPRYLAAGRAAKKAGGDGYRDNPFEVAARQAADVVSSDPSGPRERP